MQPAYDPGVFDEKAQLSAIADQGGQRPIFQDLADADVPVLD